MENLKRNNCLVEKVYKCIGFHEDCQYYKPFDNFNRTCDFESMGMCKSNKAIKATEQEQL